MAKIVQEHLDSAERYVAGLEATIRQQAAWLEAFREFVVAADAVDNCVNMYCADDVFNVARAAITPEAMGE